MRPSRCEGVYHEIRTFVLLNMRCAKLFACVTRCDRRERRLSTGELAGLGRARLFSGERWILLRLKGWKA